MCIKYSGKYVSSLAKKLWFLINSDFLFIPCGSGDTSTNRTRIEKGICRCKRKKCYEMKYPLFTCLPLSTFVYMRSVLFHTEIDTTRCNEKRIHAFESWFGLFNYAGRISMKCSARAVGRQSLRIMFSMSELQTYRNGKCMNRK